MTLTPLQLQIAGILVLIAIGVALIWWIVNAVVRPLRGRATYLLGELPDRDADEGDDDDDDGDDGIDAR